MYERALTHLEMTGVGIAGKDPKIRGENLGKAIAIIAELNASVKEDDTSEAALFLRGLYSAILVELPKAAIADDAKIVQQTISYIKRLKEIWEQTAMQDGYEKKKAESRGFARPDLEERKMNVGPAKAAVQGLSFSV